MKTKRSLTSVLVALAIVVLASCSGHKAETTEGHDHAATATAAPETELKTFENVDPSVKEQLNGFLTDYFILNQFLIEDNAAGAKDAAKKLSETVAKFDMSKLVGEQMDFYHIQAGKLNQGLKGIAASGDIEETRAELSTVSDALYALVKGYHSNESALYRQFCPMAKNNAGAFWLSSTKEIINPYMGQRMLKCGSTKETL